MPQSRLPLFNRHFCLKCSKHFFVSSCFLCKFQMFQSKTILPKLPTSLRGACVSCCRGSHRHWVLKTSGWWPWKEKRRKWNEKNIPENFWKGFSLSVSVFIMESCARRLWSEVCVQFTRPIRPLMSPLRRKRPPPLQVSATSLRSRRRCQDRLCVSAVTCL